MTTPLSRRPRAVLRGRGYARLSEDSPPTSPLKQQVLDLAAPLLTHLGSTAGFDTGERLVALTYDDGLHPVRTPLVLDELARTGRRAPSSCWPSGPRPSRPSLAAWCRRDTRSACTGSTTGG